jgi:hypothetical protein
VVGETTTSVTLTWEPPENLGGRDDVSYLLCYAVAGIEGVEMCASVQDTTGTITGKQLGLPAKCMSSLLCW